MTEGNLRGVRRQGGFSIVTAIFLIVVLAALGAFAVSMFRVQQTTAAYDELGVRGYQAAQAGIEWGHGRCSGTVALARRQRIWRCPARSRPLP
ncbi:MAG: hypothetical protein M5R42_02480 [Rhodocyclaceae bacterium]|nr:hypothetical protein [Rhodocyclaceae bacterium]